MAERELTEHPLGLTWREVAGIERAAHALVHEGRVWLVDAYTDEEALERARALGEIQSVLQLFVAHGRDGAAIAQRFGVPFEPFPDVVRDSPFSVLDLG